MGTQFVKFEKKTTLSKAIARNALENFQTEYNVLL